LDGKYSLNVNLSKAQIPGHYHGTMRIAEQQNVSGGSEGDEYQNSGQIYNFSL